MAEPEKTVPSQEAKPAAKDSSGAKSLLRNTAFLYGAGTFLLVAGLAGTVFAGYRTALADVEKTDVEEEPVLEEEEEIVEFSPEEYRPVPGIDLARERSPDAGAGERVIGLSTALTKAPAVTRAATSLDLPPDTAHELVKPLDVRSLPDKRIERTIGEASAVLADAGGLGAVEPLRRKKAEARSADSTSALVPVPGVSLPGTRTPSAEPLPGLYSSTILPPRDYTISVTPRRPDDPEKLELR
ncbi:MAG: hypothetical protein AAB229_06930 [Candidatus Hydrogenedentota bacterium]